MGIEEEAKHIPSLAVRIYTDYVIYRADEHNGCGEEQREYFRRGLVRDLMEDINRIEELLRKIKEDINRPSQRD